jgi:uncharacterized Ntn-hydrolase superfamily protein
MRQTCLPVRQIIFCVILNYNNMKSFITILFVMFFFQKASSQHHNQSEPWVSTYSIVAYDSITGDMGVAVQSHWFSVGSIVLWGEAGVGVVATQSLVNPAFGPQGLALLKTGLNAEAVVQALVESDEGRDFRQLAVLDNNGLAKAYTGAKCIEDAGHIEGNGYSVQANMMANSKVWSAMAKAYENGTGSLAEKLVAALDAAQQAGGDIRGKQSAALLVVSGKATGKIWEDRKVDLRIEDHPDPVQEMKRLLKVHQAYQFMNAGDVAMEHGDVAAAQQAYANAQQLFPENIEMKYWNAVNLANAGRMEEALPIFKSIFTQNEDWRTLTARLVKPGILVVSEEDLKRIIKG